MKKKIIPFLIAIGAAGTALGACGNATQPAEPTTAAETTITGTTTTIAETEITTEKAEPNSIESAAGLGETVHFEQPPNLADSHDWEITVNNIAVADEITIIDQLMTYTTTPQAASDGNKFILVNMHLKNTGKEKQYFMTADTFDGVELIYDDGYKFTTQYVTGDPAGYDRTNILYSVEVEALKESDAQIAFDVPAEVADNTDKPLYLHMFADKTVGEQNIYIKLR